MGFPHDESPSVPVLHVRYRAPAHPDVAPLQDLTLQVVHLYRPFTFSVVCRVKPIVANPLGHASHPALPDECILKLYDRREVGGFRHTFGGEPHDKKKERAYQAYRSKPGVENFDYESDIFLSDKGSVCDSNERFQNDGHFESFVAHECHKMWKQEVAAYEELRSVQGSAIPRLLGVVECQVGEDPNHLDSDPVRGILIEYIPAPTLRQYLTHAICDSGSLDRDEIASVCREAIAQVDALDDTKVLNVDVRLDNILVRNRGGSAVSSPPILI